MGATANRYGISLCDYKNVLELVVMVVQLFKYIKIH